MCSNRFRKKNLSIAQVKGVGRQIVRNTNAAFIIFITNHGKVWIPHRLAELAGNRGEDRTPIKRNFIDNKGNVIYDVDYPKPKPFTDYIGRVPGLLWRYFFAMEKVYKTSAENLYEAKQTQWIK